MPQTIFLVGPTCVGKSKVSINLAKLINAEIVSCDSMQVYQGMDIGTAKPAKAEQKKVPHHVIDVVNLTQEYNVAHYVKDAQQVIENIKNRSRVPLVVGGTGLYFKALIDGLFEIPSGTEEIRNQIKKRLENEGLPALYNELKEKDPAACNKIKPNDKRRIIRALEVFYTTGKPISSLQTQWKKEKLSTSPFSSPYKGEEIIIGLNRDRDDLYKRINNRVEDMFKNGFVDEVKGLVKQGLEKNKTASQALGYKEILAYLGGKYTLEETKELIKKNTRHFAKRQLTWFRKDDRVKWILIEANENINSVVRRVERILNF